MGCTRTTVLMLSGSVKTAGRDAMMQALTVPVPNALLIEVMNELGVLAATFRKEVAEDGKARPAKCVEVLPPE